LIKTECFRDNNWKFIRYEDHPEFYELYNLKDDVQEMHNLAFDKKYRDRVRDYAQKCDAAAARYLSKRVDPLH
jgi:arylsulfatase A-like enzyme